MSSNQVNAGRRKVLLGATTGVFAVGAGFTAVPFVSAMSPSERAKAAGAPVEIDLSKVAMGQRVSLVYRGKTVWVVRRSKEVLDNIVSLNSRVLDPNSTGSQQPEYCANDTRAIAGKEEIFVAIAHCTHLGCIPSYRPEVGPQGFDPNWKGGFYCPCHGSRFDLAGRVFPNVPAPCNLVIPKYAYVGDNKLIVGLDPSEVKGAS
jgi:ubiquinol-cytochrome c reductase iron-sulfur subunit